jgi:hypothetical protein
VRFRYSVTPNLFRVVAPTTHPYVAVRAIESGGEVVEMRAWRYLDGAYGSDLGTLAGSFGDRAEIAAAIGVISSDPAGLVAAGSIYWSRAVWDFEAETLHTFSTSPATTTSPPIWGGDGWLYWLDWRGDVSTVQLRRVRADGTSIQDVSDTLFDGDFPEPFGLCHLTPEAMVCYRPGPEAGSERVLVFPRDGSSPSVEPAPGIGYAPAAPFRCGLPQSAGQAVFLLTSGSEVRAWRYTEPASEAALWPSSWATWDDPNGSAEVLSHSLSADGSELVVYRANGGLIRVPAGVQAGDPPAAIAVEAHGGETPDFMLPLD